MLKAHQTWTVLPHGELTEIDPNLLTVTGSIRMPFTEMPRRMTVARISGERLVVFNPIALDEDGMRELEGYGQPAFMVVPNDKHRLDAKIWKDRYPAIQVVAPAGARMKIEEVVRVDSTNPGFDDSYVHFITVPGTGQREAAMLVYTPRGATLVLNDLVGNIRQANGFGGWFLHKMKFAGAAPQIPLPVQWTLIDDRAALRAQFLLWSELPTLKRILVSHGEPIDEDPEVVLRDLAQSLAEDRPDHELAA